METNIVREFDKKISDETIINIPRKKTYDEIIDELEEENENLASNMPWNTIEQATEITITDAAKYSRNKLELFGNTEQAQLEVIETLDIIDGIITGRGVVSYGQANGKICIIPCKPNNIYQIKKDKVTKRFRICDYPTLINASTTLHNYQNESGATLETTYLTSDDANYIYIWCWYSSEGDTEDNIPIITAEIGINPDYPQDIHVVSGENDIYWTSNENKLDLNKKYIKGGINSSTGAINTTANPTITLGNNSISVYTSSAWNGYISDYYDCQSKDIIQLNFVASTNYFWVAIAEYDLNKQYIKATPISNTSLREINIKTTNETKYLRLIFEGSRSGYSIDFTNINFVIQNHVILNLGSLELCKIKQNATSSIQDYFFKEDSNWYEYKAIIKRTINNITNWAIQSNSKQREKTRVFEHNFVDKAVGRVISNNFKNKGVVLTTTDDEEYIGDGAGYNQRVYISIKKDRLVGYDDSMTDSQANQLFQTWLSNSNTLLYYINFTPTITQITDTTLIAQLDAIYEHLKLVKGTNNITVTAEDLAPYMQLSYMQDLPTKLDKLEPMVIENS